MRTLFNLILYLVGYSAVIMLSIIYMPVYFVCEVMTSVANFIHKYMIDNRI